MQQTTMTGTPRPMPDQTPDQMPDETSRPAARPAIALIGCGLWGRNIARTLCELGLLAGVADRNGAAAADFSREFSAPVMGIAQILASEATHGVVIAAPASAHAELAIAAIKAGKAVFVEKPLALNLNDAEAIAAAIKAAAHPRPFMVGHLIRHHAGFKHLLGLVKGGAIGRLRHIRCDRLAPGRVRHSESVVYDLCCHDLALIAALTDQAPPRGIQCHGFSHLTPGVEDGIMAQIDFGPTGSGDSGGTGGMGNAGNAGGGVVATLQANWMNPVKIHTLTVIGTEAALVFDDTKPWEAKLTRHAFAAGHDGTSPYLNCGAAEAMTIPESPPLEDAMRLFARAITDGADPITGIDEALYVQRLLARMDAAMGQKETL